MPLVKPFRAVRYAVGAAGPLDDLVAPPYDVISRPELARLVAASPYNVVRLIRPQEPALAAERFRTWQEAGVLVRDERPAVWRSEEEYVGPDGVRRVRRGLVARVRLDPRGEGCVLPHERTMSKPKDDRLNLMRACRANLSPVWGLSLAEGLSSPQISQRLYVATSTIETHRRNIARKLGLHGVADLTKYAIREGLTSLE